MSNPYPTKTNIGSRLMNLVLRKRKVPEGSFLDLGGVHLPLSPNLQRGNLLASGSADSGLTSGVVIPMIDRLIAEYGNSTARIGGLIIDPEGGCADQVAYFMAQAGRNPVEELVCLRPTSDLPLVRFRDPASGKCYFVNGQPTSPTARSEAARLIERGQAGVPKRERINPEICSRHERDSSAAIPVLRNLRCRVTSEDVRYLGWRFTNDSRSTLVENSATGEGATRPAPTELVFEDMIRRPLGERFNPGASAAMPAEVYADMICDVFFPPTGRGPVFAKVKPAIVAACRLCSLTGRTPSLSELCRLLVNDTLLGERLEQVRLLPGAKSAGSRAAVGAELSRFFAEWTGLDSRSRHDLVALFTNAFGAFVTNEALARTFCGEPTFDFAGVLNTGKIVVADLSRGPDPRALGALLEADFQRTVRARRVSSTLNRSRMLLNVVPLWSYLPASGRGALPGGFIREGAQTGAFNLLTAGGAEDPWVPGDQPLIEAALAPVANFVWLRCDHPAWNAVAAKLHGRCQPGDFAGLDPWDAVVRAQTGPAGRSRDAAVSLTPSPATAPEIQAKIAEFMRDFMRDWIERGLKKQRISVASLG